LKSIVLKRRQLQVYLQMRQCVVATVLESPAMAQDGHFARRQPIDKLTPICLLLGLDPCIATKTCRAEMPEARAAMTNSGEACRQPRRLREGEREAEECGSFLLIL
jgi:hypothetical protein